jgi:hypothetical protein
MLNINGPKEDPHRTADLKSPRARRKTAKDVDRGVSTDEAVMERTDTTRGKSKVAKCSNNNL